MLQLGPQGAVDLAGAVPAVDDATFAMRQRELRSALAAIDTLPVDVAVAADVGRPAALAV